MPRTAKPDAATVPEADLDAIMAGGMALDMSGVSEGFEALPPGRYEAVITDVTAKQGSKAPYLNWELTIAEGEFEDRKLWLMTSLAPQALFGIKNLMRAAGIDPTELQGPVVMPTPTFFVGARVVAITTQEEYPEGSGEMRTRVKTLDRSDHTAPLSLTPQTGSGARRSRSRG
jgi:hypothetical protein